MPRIAHSILLKAYKKRPLLSLVLRGSRTLPSAINELRWLTEHVERTCFKSASKIKQQQLLHLCKRRARGEPLQYILESQPFGELDIKCRPKVLIPRPETEAYTTYLAELIGSHRLNRILNNEFSSGDDPLRTRVAEIPPLRILDLCTGSGCIPLLLNNLLSRSVPNLEIHGWDISKFAIALANENLTHNVGLGHVNISRQKRLGFEVVDIFDCDEKLKSVLERNLDQARESPKVNIIISNPPYISQTAFWRETARSVRNWEPKLALVPEKPPQFETLAEVDAADVFYKRLLELYSDVFESDVLLMEVGDESQALRVAEMALRYCGPPDGQNTNTRASHHVEIWRDIPDSGHHEELELGGHKISARGSGHARAVVLFKFRYP